jgi:hypothetical protein
MGYTKWRRIGPVALFPPDIPVCAFLSVYPADQPGPAIHASCDEIGAQEMSAHLQRLSEVELQSYKTCDGEPSSVKHLAREARPESRIPDFMMVLERLWIFYKAMREGKPLTDADQMLAQVGTILRDATKTRHASNCEERPTKHRHGD